MLNPSAWSKASRSDGEEGLCLRQAIFAQTFCDRVYPRGNVKLGGDAKQGASRDHPPPSNKAVKFDNDAQIDAASDLCNPGGGDGGKRITDTRARAQNIVTNTMTVEAREKFSLVVGLVTPHARAVAAARRSLSMLGLRV